MDLDDFLTQEKRNREIRRQSANPLQRGAPVNVRQSTGKAAPTVRRPQAQNQKGVNANQVIDNATTPWVNRPRSDGRFAQESAEDFVSNSKSAVESVVINESRLPQDRISHEELRKQVSRKTGLSLDPANNQLSKFIARAKRDGRSMDIEYAVPNTLGGEMLWRDMIDGSGNPTSLHHGGDTTATDLISQINNRQELVDVQNMYGNDIFKAGVMKNMGYNQRQDFEKIWTNADVDRPFSEILKDYENYYGGTQNGISAFERQRIGNDKLLQSNRGYLSELAKDQHMRYDIERIARRETPVHRKDVMVGGRFSQQPDYTGRKNMGTYDPQMFEKGYALDLDSMRNKIIPASKRQLKEMRVSPIFDRNSIRFEMPMDVAKDLGRGGETLDAVLSPNMQRAVKDAGGNFYAGLGIVGDPDQLIKGAVKGRVGGLVNAAFNGASRETGKRIAKGDYVGAATEFGTNYAVGAAADVGLRKAGQAILTRLPAALAKGAAGTVSSGGWAAPMAAAYTAYEVADGAVEGFTGKGLSTRMEEASDNAVTSAYERRFDQPAPRGGFVPKDKPQVKREVKKEPLSLEQINNAVEATKGLAPEAEAAPAQITKATPQVKAPEANNFVSQWTNKVKSWFK